MERRAKVVQLGILADALNGCDLCSQPLHLIDCIGEKKFGLSSMLKIKCHHCSLVNDIPTGGRHKTKKDRLAWDANSKLAAEATADIVQIAAVCENKSLNVYINPTKPIGLKASEVTGLTFTGGILRLNGEEVPATTIQDGLKQFLTFIKTFKNPVLVGNNIQAFDLPRLYFHLKKYSYFEEFKATVHHFLDTLKLAKHIIPKQNA